MSQPLLVMYSECMGLLSLNISAMQVPDHGCKTQNVQHYQMIEVTLCPFPLPNHLTHAALQGTSFIGNTCCCAIRVGNVLELPLR